MTAYSAPTVLKLGGSVLTEKAGRDALDEGAIDGTVGTIAESLREPPGLVVVHGGGSFGHPRAAAHGVDTERGTTDAGAALEIHRGMTRLNAVLVDRLQAAGVPALPVRPLSAAHRDRSGALRLASAPTAGLLAEGFVPVLHGDVVGSQGAGVTVTSGDEIVATLATDLEADRVGVCSTVPGVLDGEGAVIDRLESRATARSVLGESGETDVTGGMAGKVEALFGLETPAAIFGPDDLGAFLAGDLPGTTVGTDPGTF